MSAPPSTTSAGPSLAPPSTASKPPRAPPSNLSSTLPHGPANTTHSPETARQIAEARAALEASMSNIGSSLDSTLRSRAQNLHSNSAQLEKQQKDVIRETAGLRKESEKLRKVAEEGSKRVKELGNVQNWAEMLERDFLVLGATLRLANGEGSQGSWETDSGSERTGGWLEEEDSKFEEELRGVDGEGDVEMGGSEAVKQVDGEEGMDGKGKGVETQERGGETQQQENVGGSSTATIGSGSDPSSSSVHTWNSAIS